MQGVATDGSALVDSELPTVEIDRSDEPYRWRCPNGHSEWEHTNRSGTF